MATEKAYIVKLSETEQIGPIDEEALIKLAGSGQIPQDAQIRNTLVPVWSKAREVDCLKKLFKQQSRARATQIEISPWNSFKAKISRRGDYDPLAQALSQEGITYHQSSLFIRFFAALIDVLILAVISVATLFACWALQTIHLLPENGSFYIFMLLDWMLCCLYFIYMVNTYSQTMGQRFWGLVLVNEDKTPIYPARAMCYFLLWLVFGLLSPVTYIFTGLRFTLQEWATKLLVRRIIVARRNA